MKIKILNKLLLMIMKKIKIIIIHSNKKKKKKKKLIQNSNASWKSITTKKNKGDTHNS